MMTGLILDDVSFKGLYFFIDMCNISPRVIEGTQVEKPEFISAFKHFLIVEEIIIELVFNFAYKAGSHIAGFVIPTLILTNVHADIKHRVWYVQIFVDDCKIDLLIQV